MASLDYTKLNDHYKHIRGQAEDLSDSQTRAVNELVVKQHESNRLPAGARVLARDIVVNYEGADTYLLDLQSKHGKHRAWLPGASATRTILTIVGYDFDASTAS